MRRLNFIIILMLAASPALAQFQSDRFDTIWFMDDDGSTSHAADYDWATTVPLIGTDETITGSWTYSARPQMTLGLTIGTSDTLTYSSGNDRFESSANLYAPAFYGDGSNLTGLVADSANSLSDDDGDTSVEVEAATDEDVIRMQTAGVERVTIDATGTTTTRDLYVSKSAPFIFLSGIVPGIRFASGHNGGADYWNFYQNANASVDFGLLLRKYGTGAGIRAAFLSGETVFNQDGLSIDHRIEGDTDPNLVNADASTDRVGIGTATPSAKLDVNGDAKADNFRGMNIGSVGDLIQNYPRVGSSATVFDEANTTELDMMYLGAGNSGVIRQMFFTSPNMTPTTISQLQLRIYVDAGNIADTSSPPSANLAAAIPLGVLTGLELHSAYKSHNTRYVDVSSVNSTYGDFVSIQLRFPIPYSDGVLVQLYDTNAGARIATKYYWISYQDGTLPTGRYSDWRLKSDVYDGSISATNTITYMTESSGAGGMLGLWVSTTARGPNSDGAFWENNWKWHLDKAGATTGNAEWETSGGEDIFNNPYYFSVGEQVDYDYGIYEVDSSGTEGFMYFDQTGLEWDNGSVGQFYYGYGDSGTKDMHVLSLYYAPL